MSELPLFAAIDRKISAASLDLRGAVQTFIDERPATSAARSSESMKRYTAEREIAWMDGATALPTAHKLTLVR